MKRNIYILVILGLLFYYPSVIYAEGNFEKCMVGNPYHILVNKTHALEKAYKPSNLIMPNVRFANKGNIEKNYMEYGAAKALEKMFKAAEQEGIRLVAVSGYRSYARQEQLYHHAVARSGVNQDGTAKPGESEHQTGLAMDVNTISQSFGRTKEGKWLAQNAHKFGYIIRYLAGKEQITGYMYEPWHIRYVGEELATYCYTNKIVLEEVEYCCINEKQVHMKVTENQKANTCDILEYAGKTYIKARDLVELMGGYITFEKGILKLYLKENIFMMKEQQNKVMLNNQIINLDTPVIRVGQTMYLPLRGILECLGYNVSRIGNIIIV